MTLAFESGRLQRMQRKPTINGAGMMEEDDIFYFLRSEPRVRAAVAEAAWRLAPSPTAALCVGGRCRHPVLRFVAAQPFDPVGADNVPTRHASNSAAAIRRSSR